jgi:hypothetical protein
VIVAAVATGFGALPLVLGFGESSVPTGALYGAGWPAFGVAGALLLDRGTEPRIGRTLAALALVPAAMVAIALPREGTSVWTRVEGLWRAADVVVMLLTLVLLAWAMGYAPGRTARRRLFWLLVWSAVVFAAVVVSDAVLDTRAQSVVLTLSLWSLAGIVARLAVAKEIRPVDEPFLDVVAGALTLAIGAAVGVGVRLAGTRAGIPLRTSLPLSPP